jgi:hypothetical protein
LNESAKSATYVLSRLSASVPTDMRRSFLPGCIILGLISRLKRG